MWTDGAGALGEPPGDLNSTSTGQLARTLDLEASCFTFTDLMIVFVKETKFPVAGATCMSGSHAALLLLKGHATTLMPARRGT